MRRVSRASSERREGDGRGLGVALEGAGLSDGPSSLLGEGDFENERKERVEGDPGREPGWDGETVASIWRQETTD